MVRLMQCPQCGADARIPPAAFYTPGQYEATCTRDSSHTVPFTSGPFIPAGQNPSPEGGPSVAAL